MSVNMMMDMKLVMGVLQWDRGIETLCESGIRWSGWLLMLSPVAQCAISLAQPAVFMFTPFSDEYECGALDLASIGDLWSHHSQ